MKGLSRRRGSRRRVTERQQKPGNGDDDCGGAAALCGSLGSGGLHRCRRQSSERRYVKTEGEAADTAVVMKRPRLKLFRLRDPEWRDDVAFRLGFPLLGAVVAVALVWLITQA